MWVVLFFYFVVFRALQLDSSLHRTNTIVGVLRAHTYTSIHALLCSCLEVEHIHSMTSRLRLSSAFLLLLLLFSPPQEIEVSWHVYCDSNNDKTTTSSVKRRLKKTTKKTLFVACTDTRQNRAISLPSFFVSHSFVRFSKTHLITLFLLLLARGAVQLSLPPFKHLG